jgi:hypothetical protein
MNNLEPDLVDWIELKSDVLVAACMRQVDNVKKPLSFGYCPSVFEWVVQYSIKSLAQHGKHLNGSVPLLNGSVPLLMSYQQLALQL